MNLYAPIQLHALTYTHVLTIARESKSLLERCSLLVISFSLYYMEAGLLLYFLCDRAENPRVL